VTISPDRPDRPDRLERSERRTAKSDLPRPRLLPIAAPMFVELILGIGVGLVSTALAARLSDTSAAAFSLAHHVFAMLFILFRVVGAGWGWWWRRAWEVAGATWLTRWRAPPWAPAPGWGC